MIQRIIRPVDWMQNFALAVFKTLIYGQNDHVSRAPEPPVVEQPG